MCLYSRSLSYGQGGHPEKFIWWSLHSIPLWANSKDIPLGGWFGTGLLLWRRMYITEKIFFPLKEPQSVVNALVSRAWPGAQSPWRSPCSAVAIWDSPAWERLLAPGLLEELMPTFLRLYTIWPNISFHLDLMSLVSVQCVLWLHWDSCCPSFCLTVFTHVILFSRRHESLYFQITSPVFPRFPAPPHLKSSLTNLCVSDTTSYLSRLVVLYFNL